MELQKIFDANARAWGRALEEIDGPVIKHPAAALKGLFAGCMCEATAVAAKVTHQPLDTERFFIKGFFF